MGGVCVAIVGLREKDDKWDLMMRAKHACKAAGIDYPQGLYDYFGTNPKNSEATLFEHMFEIEIPYSGDEKLEEGLIIDVSDIPEGVGKIRIRLEAD